MSAKGQGQGAELRPRPPRYRQTSLYQGNPLWPDSYLFQKKLNDDLAQAHLLGTSVKARRDGAIADYIAPPAYLKLSTEKSTKQTAKETQLSPEDLQMMGHTPELHDSWPRIEPTNRFRILHANVHGLHPSNNNMELDTFIQHAIHHQIDMLAVVEVNQPLEKRDIRTCITKTIKSSDKHATVNFGFSDVPTTNKGWQMGGTLSFVQGGGAGLVNAMGSDGCGRWSWTRLGKQNLCVIMDLKPCAAWK